MTPETTTSTSSSRAWRTLVEFKGPLLAFLGVAMLSVFSMGALGGVLFHLVFPLLPSEVDSINALPADMAWPAMIWSGLAWSPFFLVAGWVDRSRERRGASRGSRIFTYLVVLWLGAVVAWRWVLWALSGGA